MDDLPELPFEQMLSYLSLEDRLKARAVSRKWYHWINSFKVKSLCYSNRSSGIIWKRRRWVNGAFAQNFISSSRFATFFDTFGQTILSSLKHLRLCGLLLKKRNRKAFTRTLNSLSQLEQLDIIQVEFYQQDVFKLKKLNIIQTELNQQDVFKLNLPMLTSLQLEEVYGIEKLTLEAPRLREVKLACSHLRVEIVDSESVERLLVDSSAYIDVKKLKNLQYLYVDYLPGIDSTLLSSLQHLKEIHTNKPGDVSKLLAEKQRSGRDELKIYFRGLLLNGPDDPAIIALDEPYYLNTESFVCLAENPSRWADEIPFDSYLHYSAVEAVAPGLEVDLLKRFTDLDHIDVRRPVRDIQRFLDLLMNLQHISTLIFRCDQQQDLFDRLPEHCAVQSLFINRRPSDLAFLFRLKHLIYLDINWSIDSETVRRAFEELPFFSSLRFYCPGRDCVTIVSIHPKQFHVSIGKEKKIFSDLNAAIKFIFRKEKPSKPKKCRRPKVASICSVH